MNSKLILTSLISILASGFFGSSVYAGQIEYSRNSDFTLSKDDINLTFTSGSSADLVTVGASTITVAISGSDKFKIRSSDKYELNNDAGIAFTCKDNYSELIISGDRIVVVTPSPKKCTLPSKVPPPGTVSPETASTGTTSPTEDSLTPTNDNPAGVAPINTNATIQDTLNELSRLQTELESLDKNHVPICGYIRDLVIGLEGEDVSALQKELIMGGFLNVAPTGYFGAATKMAVSLWQKENKVSPANGYFGPISRVKMQGSAAMSDSASCIVRDLGIGSEGEDVWILQNFLKSQGPDIYPEGLITSRFGLLTQVAVQKFQLKYGSVAKAGDQGYGNAGPKTRAKMVELSK